VILRAGDNIEVAPPLVARDYDIVCPHLQADTLNPQFGPNGRDFLLRVDQQRRLRLPRQRWRRRATCRVSVAGIDAGQGQRRRDASLTADAAASRSTPT
jgi:hypothetical protein